MTNTLIPKKNRLEILNFPVDLIKMEDAVLFIENKLINREFCHVVTINPEMIMNGRKDIEFGNILKKADLIVPDGIGVIIALKYYGIKNIPRLPGIELSSNLLKKCSEKNYKIGFLGAKTDVVDEACKNIKSKYPGVEIVFKRDGYFTQDHESVIIEEIIKAQPQILFVALGVPKQELFISRHKKILSFATMIGVGGSFDVWAEKVKRAPVFFRKFGLEWLYRTIKQPARFKRIFPVLPVFLIKVLLHKLSMRKDKKND